MRLRCNPASLMTHPSFNLLKHSASGRPLLRIAVTTACLTALGLFLPLSQATAADISSPLRSNTWTIADNTGYNGATLPAPVKGQKNQVAASEDAPDDAPRKHRHRRDADADMSTANDTAGGATLPPPRKGQKPGDFAGARASNDESKPAGPGGGPPGDRKGFHDHGGGSMFGKGPLDLTALNLTDDQKQKIAQMHADNGQKMRELMRKRGELSGQMRDVMFQADSTEGQIKAKRDEVRQIQEKLEDLRLNDFLSIRSILTPEQKLKLKEVKIANKHNEGDGPPGGPPKRAEGPEPKRLADTQPK